VAFYVPLGPRGLLFRLGTFLIGIWGGLAYRLAYRRRTVVRQNPETLPVRHFEVERCLPIELASSLPRT
jgi:hypothetical protein